MPWVRFVKGFHYHVPGKPVMFVYKYGQVKLVTTPCATQAIAEGRAVPTERPRDGDASEIR